MNKNNFFVWRKDADHCPKPFLQQPGFLQQAAGAQAAGSSWFFREGGRVLNHYVVQIWKQYVKKWIVGEFSKKYSQVVDASTLYSRVLRYLKWQNR